MSEIGQDNFDTLGQLTVDNKTYNYFSLSAAALKPDEISRLPYSLRILLENVLRHGGNPADVEQHIQTIVNRGLIAHNDEKIPFYPSRAILDKDSGIEPLIDLATMRDNAVHAGYPADKINPSIPTDLFIRSTNIEENEEEPNRLIQWGQQALINFNVVYCDDNNYLESQLDYFSKTVWSHTGTNSTLAYPDSCAITGMGLATVNALGLLGRNSNTIETEAALLGAPLSLPIPQIIGVELTGKAIADVPTSDIAAHIHAELMVRNVAGTYIEFFGEALEYIPLPSRAALSASALKAGAISGLFPIDQQTIEGLALNGRDSHTLNLIKAYTQAQKLWLNPQQSQPEYDLVVKIDCSQTPMRQAPKQTKTHRIGTRHCTLHKAPETKHANSTYSWDSDSTSIKPSQLPAIAITPTENGFKGARILALLDASTNEDNAQQVAPIDGYAQSASQHHDTTTSSLVIFGGQEYGSALIEGYDTRSIRSAGVRAIIAESFDDTHRSELITLGILPLEFIDGDSWQALALTGEETIEIDLPKELYPFEPAVMVIHRHNGRRELVELTARLDSDIEVSHYQTGGFLASALQKMIN